MSRNNNLGPVVPYRRRHEPAIRPILAGLGDGSADLVGCVSVLGHLYPDWPVRPVDGMQTQLMTVGRLFCIECKSARGRLSADQKRWADAVRRLGGFCGVARSKEEALAAVERCRRGESQ